MPWWLLFLELFFVWMLWAMASVLSNELDKARRGIPSGQRGGVSIFPIIPMLPLGFWGAAMLADFFAAPWGTVSVGWFHAALGVSFAVFIVRDSWRVQAIDTQPESGSSADPARPQDHRDDRSSDEAPSR